jgi:hypothetical protein
MYLDYGGWLSNSSTGRVQGRRRFLAVVLEIFTDCGAGAGYPYWLAAKNEG